VAIRITKTQTQHSVTFWVCVKGHFNVITGYRNDIHRAHGPKAYDRTRAELCYQPLFSIELPPVLNSLYTLGGFIPAYEWVEEYTAQVNDLAHAFTLEMSVKIREAVEVGYVRTDPNDLSYCDQLWDITKKIEGKVGKRMKDRGIVRALIKQQVWEVVNVNLPYRVKREMGFTQKLHAAIERGKW